MVVFSAEMQNDAGTGGYRELMIPEELRDQLDAHSVITLMQASSINFMNRVDKKFILKYEELISLLKLSSKNFLIVKDQNTRFFDYRNLYLDTPGLHMFMNHQRGRNHRFKVRFREYTGYGKVFIEVKEKRKGVTSKTRRQLENIHTLEETLPLKEKIPSDAETFLEQSCPYTLDMLIPAVFSSYTRFTLIHRNGKERVTIDSNLLFTSAEKKTDRTQNLYIAEVKSAKGTGGTADISFFRMLKDLHIRPKSVSKYCIGSILTHPEIKYNQFKPTLKALKRVSYAD